MNILMKQRNGCRHRDRAEREAAQTQGSNSRSHQKLAEARKHSPLALWWVFETNKPCQAMIPFYRSGK
jgi:hypothetical protein